ncbi:MAG: ThuA domain-containing protein [Halioglobus sp.]
MAARRGGFLRFIRRLAFVIVLLLVAAGAYIYSIGAWNLVFPSTAHDERPPYLPGDLRTPAVLVFSKTNGFRHEEGITAGTVTLDSIGIGRGWDMFFTENGAVFNDEQLSNFSAVVFLNATGDMLSVSQEQSFQRWLENGGGWLGIHAAGDGSQQDWRWYMDTLIGTNFTAHILDPQFQIASVVTENVDHPAVQALPSVWDHEDEWYSFDRSPRESGFTILATVDEDSYSPIQKLPWKETDLRMGDHPIAWSTCVGSGRAMYTALGHSKKAFDNPVYKTLLGDALAWLLGEPAEGC